MTTPVSTPPDSEFSRLLDGFSQHLRNPTQVPAPEGLSPRRVAVYRELVFENIHALLSNLFPVMSQLFPQDKWRALIAEFIRDFKAETPYFPRLGQEFLFFLAERESAIDGKPFLLELAHYESMELELYLSEELSGETLTDEELSTQPLFLSALALPLAYHFPVHKITTNFQPSTAPAELTFLLMLRDQHDNVRFFELQQAHYQLISNIKNAPGLRLQAHLSGLFPDRPANEALRTAALKILAQLNDAKLLMKTLEPIQNLD